MLFEIYKRRGGWVIRHIPTKHDVMNGLAGFDKKRQAKFYVEELEASPFMWWFDDPRDIRKYNDVGEMIRYIFDAQKRAKAIK